MKTDRELLIAAMGGRLTENDDRFIDQVMKAVNTISEREYARGRAEQLEDAAKACDAIAENMRVALQAEGVTETLSVQIRLRMATAKDCAAAIRTRKEGR